MLAETGRPDREQIIAPAADADAEAKRLEGALLAEDDVRRGELGGGLEGKGVRVAVPIEPLGAQRFGLAHRSSLRGLEGAVPRAPSRWPWAPPPGATSSGDLHRLEAPAQ